MIHTIRTSKVSKVIASYLAIQLILTTVQPSNIFALTSGPSQPEFNTFTPIGTSDMVNLSTGDFNYNIPIMDVGGYPLNLSYNSGVTMDQEASWVGLGWNLNVGQINRQVRGIPDDFKGDEMIYEKNIKPNITVGISAQAAIQILGAEGEDYAKPSLGMGIKYNNYHGISFEPSYGLSFDIGKYVSVGMNLQTSATEGATVSPSLNAKNTLFATNSAALSGGLNIGLSYNSNRGLTSFGLNASLKSSFSGKLGGVLANSNMGTATAGLSFSQPTPIAPRKRTAFKDFNSTFSFSMDLSSLGVDGEGEISASASVQKIKDKIRTEKAYGYEFTGLATQNDIIDYNRENDRPISDNLNALPYTNYTYDLYTVNGQGIGGMFRPHRSQIGQIYDEYVKDESTGFSLGVELGTGPNGLHLGGNFVTSPSKCHTGVWKTKASSTFENENENLKNSLSNLDYEPVYFKYVGENKVDDESALYTNTLNGDKAMALKLGGIDAASYADKRFRIKDYRSNIPQETLKSFNGKFKRSKREVRNQSIQKITAGELRDLYSDAYLKENINKYAKDHHTAEIQILKPDGSTYIFGETAYNIEKQEVTFATNNTGNCATGIVTYNSGENSKYNKAGIDHFYDNIKTPAYAHTYLLSSVLSSDYEDLTGNGPSDDDLGSYTRFEYKEQDNIFQWRIPFGLNEASYNEGLRSDGASKKGSYLYGRKEVKYIRKIETKTHVAIFKLSDREDAIGVNTENGGPGPGRLQKIDEIKLYSKPEYMQFQEELENKDPADDPTDLVLPPIKTAHFKYDYSLCGNLPNNTGNSVFEDGVNINAKRGKLSLKKVYFTYRNSLMGKYTPYNFAYDTDLNGNPLPVNSNPDYSLKASDIWGNYKPNNSNANCTTQGAITNAEFPFVEQQDRPIQDRYATSWALTAIGLPSGGTINLSYESDDYQYVQDRPTMQMVKVVGAGDVKDPSNPQNNQLLYVGNNPSDYLYVALPNETTTTINFQEKYLKGISDKPIYFRFLLNMTRRGALNTSSNNYDYVTGYFTIRDVSGCHVFADTNGHIFAAIPLATTDMEGGVNGPTQVNPISKAGWYFGRKYLNGIVYGLNQDHRSENVETIAKKLVESISAIGEIFTGPNQKLRDKLCASNFIPNKSWIRLSSPKPNKLGGGARIKQLVMSDKWDSMASGGATQTYGQTYDYTLEDGTSSGVATFEPNDSAENPFVEPFYDDPERLIAPQEVSYVEKPFGKAFFPFSKVTYSQVTVKNLERTDITRHATGKVVSEFYTTKDFPTKVDHTQIEAKYKNDEGSILENLIGSYFGIPLSVTKKFTLSQGYAIHTNDMDGKSKSQKVYQEGMDKPISSVIYKYSTKSDNDAILNNKLPVIAKDGSISYDKEIGVDYDVITDFREAYSESKTRGFNTNVAGFLLPPPIPIIIPTQFLVSNTHENIAHSVIVTKVVHTTAILKEKIATDLGATVSTTNQAWDVQTGEILLTKTINEFDDAYYNFNFPAYWAYNNMGQASRNLGLKGTLQYNEDYFTLTNANTYLTLGDEIIANYGTEPKRLWVVEFNADGSGVLLMNRLGGVVNREGGEAIQQDIQFRVVRSGYQNQQMGNMASITMMKNPLIDQTGNAVSSINTATFEPVTGSATDNLRIVNASAVAYNDFWNCQCENSLPFIPHAGLDTEALADLSIEEYAFNPYLYNVKNEWRAEKSYAYLTERTNVKQGTNTTKKNNRKAGYFKTFNSYYTLNNGQWETNASAAPHWTFASEVTQYSAFGAEVENKDALDRYSSAQYGYNHTLPVVVASNSKYRYMGADNFEDYKFLNTEKGHFSYKDIVDQDGDKGLVISNTQAHTGSSSLLIAPDSPAGAALPVELIGEAPPVTDTDGDNFPDTIDNCKYTPNSQLDYDDNDIGDDCDDYSVPIITNARVTGQFSWWRKQAVFTIQGKPNDIVRAKVINVRPGSHGWKASLNGEAIFTTQTKEFEIQLDAVGRANMTLEMGITAPKYENRVQGNKTAISFVLFNKFNNNPVSPRQQIRLEVKGYKDINSGKDDGAAAIFTSIL